jgi:hypothetical protein
MCILLTGCAQKTMTVRYALNSQFGLKDDEAQIPAVKEITKYFEEYCMIANSSYAMNRAIKSSPYILIGVYPEVKPDSVALLFQMDNSFNDKQSKDIKLTKAGINGIAFIASKKNNWYYSFQYWEKAIGSTIAIHICSQDKSIPEAYFSDISKIEGRLINE